MKILPSSHNVLSTSISHLRSKTAGTVLLLFVSLVSFGSRTSADSTWAPPLGVPPAGISISLQNTLLKENSELTEEDIDVVKTYAISLWKKIQAEKRILQAGQITPDKIQDLPVAIGKIDPGTGNLNYAICFDKMSITSDGKAVLQAYMVFDPPGGGENSGPMVFRAKDVTFTATGGISNAELTMLGGFTLVENEKFTVNLVGSQSGVTVDCNGFKSFKLGGQVLFNQEMIFTPEEKAQVRADFSLSAASWDDFLAELTFSSKFEVKGAPGYVFTAQNATIDMSSSRNSVTFPASYIAQAQEYAAIPTAWTGFHVQKISVMFPGKFGTTGTTAGVQDLIIDKEGVSVKLFAENLIPLEKGNADGWAFSLDKFQLDIFQNTFLAGTLAGKIRLPVMEAPLAYTGHFDAQDNYFLQAVTNQEISFDLWKTSSVTLTYSEINLNYSNGAFRPSATFSGYMAIGLSLSEKDENSGITLPTINFQNLKIQTRAPYIQATSFGIPQNAGIDITLAGFKASINQLSLKNDGDEKYGIGMNVSLNMTKIAGKEFGASGGLVIYGILNKDDGRQRWVYDDTQLERLRIAVDMSAFAIDGYLELFRSNPIYGTGFKAGVSFDLKSAYPFHAEAKAIFGTKPSSNGEKFPYWSVDVATEFSPGLPAGIVTFTGFAGGISEAMIPEASSQANDLSQSGLTYVPNETMGMNLRMSAAFTLSVPKMTKGRVGLEIAFFKQGGGLNYVALDGEAEMVPLNAQGLGILEIKQNAGLAMQRIKVRGEMAQTFAKAEELLGKITGDKLVNKQKDHTLEGKILAKLHMQYQAQEKIFHANLFVDMNLANVITGTGMAEMHFDPNTWYIWIGTPKERVNVLLDLRIAKVNVGTYFMVGKDLPGSPEPPKEIAAILNASQESLNYARDINALKSGTGIAFGLDLKAKFNATFLIFYGALEAGLGFDIMLKDYLNATCNGSTVGVNGWYANGQVYAYVKAQIGIRIKLWKFKRDIPILDLGAAALLQTKLPNPFWMKGQVRGYYSVLGGKVKGQCKFQFELGEACELVQNDPNSRLALPDVEVTESISPTNQSDQVSTTVPIKAAFSIPLNKSLSLLDDNGESFYIIPRLDARSKVTNITTNTMLPGRWAVSDDGSSAEYVFDRALPSSTQITVELYIGLFELNNKPILDDNNVPAVEYKKVVFKTDSASSKVIPRENVALSYPLIEQMNLHKSESGQGFIRLAKAQDDLLLGKSLTGKLVHESTALSLTNIQYQGGTIQFGLPSDLSNGTVYTLELALSDASSPILSYDFRTSTYATFTEKVNAMLGNQNALPLLVDSVILAKVEKLDAFDMYGGQGISPLVELEADLDNTWFQQFIAPVYGFNGNQQPRDDDYGQPAVKAVFFSQNPSSLSWSPETASEPASALAIRYLLPHYTERDFELANNYQQINADCWSGETQARYTGNDPCTNWVFTALKKGTYKINYKYKLPNGSYGVSSGSISMTY